MFPAIQSFQEHGVEFIDGTIESFDVVILATGYKSNVPYWLKVLSLFFYILIVDCTLKLIIYLIEFLFIRRKTNFSLKKMDFHADKMNGKEKMASMLLGSQNVVSLVCP